MNYFSWKMNQSRNIFIPHSLVPFVYSFLNSFYFIFLTMFAARVLSGHFAVSSFDFWYFWNEIFCRQGEFSPFWRWWTERWTTQVDSVFQWRHSHYLRHRVLFLQYGSKRRSQPKSVERIIRTFQIYMEQQVS